MKHLRKNKLQVYCTLQQVSFPDHYDFFFYVVWTELLSTLWTHLLIALRPMWKWLLHKVSGKCELLRITYEEQPGVKQTKRIGRKFHYIIPSLPSSISFLSILSWLLVYHSFI